MKYIPSIIGRVIQYVKHPRNLISSKIAMYSIGVLVLFFAYQTAQVAIKRHQTEQDIQTFEKQVADLQHTQGSLQELNQFLETDFFAEKEARLKLGMQRPGEEVVVLTGKDAEGQPVGSGDVNSENQPSTKTSSNTVASNGSSLGTPAEKSKEKSNPEKWWDYFFVTDSKK